MSELLVLDTGSANVRSMLAALERLGGVPRLARSGDEIESASHVVLPGVGTFAAAMQRLQEDRLEGALRRRLQQGRPTLCVCVGLQLLCDGSEESPDTKGLGILPYRVSSFPKEVRVPHMGWNRVVPGDTSAYLEAGYAYFANSYRIPVETPLQDVAGTSRLLDPMAGDGPMAGGRQMHDGWKRDGGGQTDRGWRWSLCTYGGPFIAACERGAVLACQFHPELSGEWGLALLQRWLMRAPREGVRC